MALPSPNDQALLQALQAESSAGAPAGAPPPGAAGPEADPIAIISQIQDLLGQLAEALGASNEPTA